MFYSLVSTFLTNLIQYQRPTSVSN